MEETKKGELKQISQTTCGFSGCSNSIGKRGNNPFPFILPNYSRCCDECYGSKIVPLRVLEGNGNDLKREKTH